MKENIIIPKENNNNNNNKIINNNKLNLPTTLNSKKTMTLFLVA